jgi:hypothetical protein
MGCMPDNRRDDLAAPVVQEVRSRRERPRAEVAGAATFSRRRGHEARRTSAA